jgi:hypothetical protein
MSHKPGRKGGLASLIGCWLEARRTTAAGLGRPASVSWRRLEAAGDSGRPIGRNPVARRQIASAPGHPCRRHPMPGGRTWILCLSGRGRIDLEPMVPGGGAFDRRPATIRPGHRRGPGRRVRCGSLRIPLLRESGCLVASVRQIEVGLAAERMQGVVGQHPVFLCPRPIDFRPWRVVILLHARFPDLVPAKRSAPGNTDRCRLFLGRRRRLYLVWVFSCGSSPRMVARVEVL